jgi:hypothetical protein
MVLSPEAIEDYTQQFHPLKTDHITCANESFNYAVQ